MQPKGLWDQLTHEQALALSVESIDTRLEPADAARLGDHLDSCSDCAAIDAEYRAIHQELRGLPLPEVPRNLWARTSAALDRAEAAPSGLSLSRLQDFLTHNVAMLSTAVAAGLVIVLIAATVVLQSPGISPRPAASDGGNVALGSAPSGLESTQPGPLAVVGGTSYWISEDAGVYEIKVGNGQCPVGQAGCSMSSGGQTLGSVKSKTPVSAVIAPDASRAAVWTDGKVAVLPLVAKPATVALDLLTPRPTTAATTTPATTPAPAATPAGDQSALPTSVASSPSTAPTAAPTVSATSIPVAILTGYEVVGLDPEFSADGLTLAFTARPRDHSTGPDVFVWRVGQDQAHAITFGHSDQVAGWYGGRVLISEFSAASTSSGAAAGYASYVFDTKTGAAERIDRPMLLPSADSTGRFVVYWAGTVEFDRASGMWRAGAGDLYFDSWSNLTLTPTTFGPVVAPTDSPTPIATAADASPAPGDTANDTPAPVPTDAGTQGQPPAATARILETTDKPGQVHDWIVRWDSSGRHAAIWVAESGSTDVGRLTVFSIDRTAGHAAVDQALPASDRVTNGLDFDDGHLVYTSASDGKTYVQDIASLAPVVVAGPTPTITDRPSDPPALLSPDPAGG